MMDMEESGEYETEGEAEGNPSAEFLTCMISHHAKALSMAHDFVAKPEDERTPEATSAAKAVIASHSSEIIKMVAALDTAKEAPKSGPVLLLGLR